MTQQFYSWIYSRNKNKKDMFKNIVSSFIYNSPQKKAAHDVRAH